MTQLELVVAMAMFAPAAAGIAIIIGCFLGEISYRKAKKKQEEQLDFLQKKMGKEKFMEFLVTLKDCGRHQQYLIDSMCKEYAD